MLWTYARIPEAFLHRELITVYLGNSNAEKNPKLLPSFEAFLTGIFRNRASNGH
jgi:hypothetical protein